jgi:DNA-binding MarR family transcriptional regulator
MSGPPEDLALRAWRAVIRGHNRILRGLDAELTEKYGLSYRAFDVLLRLSRASGSSIRISELANLVLLTPSGATRLIDQLVERALVVRKPDPSDARVQLVLLTAEGRALFRKAYTTYSRAVRRLFADHLTEEQLTAITTAFEDLTATARR